jgi:hypothetical protein
MLYLSIKLINYESVENVIKHQDVVSEIYAEYLLIYIYFEMDMK